MATLIHPTPWWGATVSEVDDDEATFRVKLGTVITALRLAHGYKSQGALAREVGVSGATAQRWEAGSASPDAWVLVWMMEHFNVSADDLLHPKDDVTPLLAHLNQRAAAGVRRGLAVRSARRGARGDAS